MDSKFLGGVNKICAQCTKECKQWNQVRIIWCPYFLSSQKKDGKKEEGGTLQACQEAKNGS